ncbi:MAG: adenosylcobinamide kinase / adenosylcobinamide-phosphate guanylyltransferase [Acidimicrobiaceae bacterium]|jgi:adenosylcobinamide kinase/adenosylcobinamide-phosphate guanylyltransferase
MITLVLGGARSGKSDTAERMAAERSTAVVYVATAILDGDADLAARVAAHQVRRPANWKTIEAGADLVGALRSATDGTVLLDALGPWVAGHDRFAVDVHALLDALSHRSGDTIVVSEEVGLGVHPSTEAGRQFRDALGDVNRAVADVADEVFLVVAGRVLPL